MPHQYWKTTPDFPKRKYIRCYSTDGTDPKNVSFYVANTDLDCLLCGKKIEADSYFRLARRKEQRDYIPCCNECLPLKVFGDVSDDRSILSSWQEPIHRLIEQAVEQKEKEENE